MPTANIGDLSLYYEESGQGEPGAARAAFVVAGGDLERCGCAFAQPTLSHDHLRLPWNGMQ